MQVRAPGGGWMEIGREGRRAVVLLLSREGRGCSRCPGDESLQAAGAGKRFGISLRPRCCFGNKSDSNKAKG